eukprot:m.18832 g.18832  ORF g.18832 m.18832 type:complete len:51 (+) comp12223_c0_seq2:949-1101(+)
MKHSLSLSISYPDALQQETERGACMSPTLPLPPPSLPRFLLLGCVDFLSN